LLVQKPKIQVVLVVVRIGLSARHRSANTGFEALALQIDLLVDLFARFLLSGARTGQNLELEGAVPPLLRAISPSRKRLVVALLPRRLCLRGLVVEEL